MSLKVYYHNVQDLFIFIEKYVDQDLTKISEADWQLLSSSIKTNKPVQKVLELALGIKKYDPDILLFVEVGGQESLMAFNKHFLDDKYEVLFKPTNSDRGIDYGVLIKKEIAPKFQIKSYRKAKLGKKGKFSRDLQCIEYGDKFKIFLIHIKSKLNLKGDDFEGRTQRSLEVNGICNIVSQYSDVPCYVCGDLNGIYDDSRGEQEFAPLRNLGFKNMLAGGPDNATFYFFDRFLHRNPMQLDYFLCKDSNRETIKSLTIGNMYDTLGNQYAHPTTLVTKRALPSDHFPLHIELDFD